MPRKSSSCAALRNEVGEVNVAENVTEAVSAFSKIFAKFQKSGSDFLKRKTEDEILQEKINSNENARKQSVSKTYKIYKDPFGTLGTASDRARTIYEDEQNLLKAYNLFKAVSDAVKSKSDKETFVSSFEIESPLTRKNSYTFGGNLIYLICWLKFEEGIGDFVPVFKESGKSYKLRFVPVSDYRFDTGDTELLSMVKEIFY